MFVIKKNQIIIIALIFMIALAGYFNYVDTGNRVDDKMVMQEEVSMKQDQQNTTIPKATAPNTTTPNSKEQSNTQEKTTKDNTKTSESQTKEVADNGEIGSAVFVDNSFNAEAKETFFLQAKMNREQTRAQRKDWLTQVINNENIPSVKKNEATDELIELQKRIEKESAIEALVEAKGFPDVYVRIDDDTIDVVVDTDTLTDQQVSQIADIVSRKTGFPMNKIKINPLKTN